MGLRARARVHRPRPFARSLGLFVGGAFREPADQRFEPTLSPATEEPIAEVAWAGPRDVAAAIETAREAQPRWAALPGRERAKYLFRIARLIQERARELAVVATLDGGKPLRESRDVDIPLAAAQFFYYAGWADKLAYGISAREVAPLGVVGQIVPWNFPLLMAAWKLAPALACGNTAILKPAETTPLTALLLAEICREAELRDGVVAVLPGDGSAGAALVRAAGVDKIAFAGSTAVGREIQTALAGRGVELTVELGGKSANIVFEDAALDQAVEGIVNGIFFNQGHVCCAGSRLLVQEGVLEDVTERLWRRMARLRVGDPLDKNTDVGAINSAAPLSGALRCCSSFERQVGTLVHRAWLHRYRTGSVRHSASPPTGESRGGLARHRGGRVNLTERERGRQREPAEPAVSVAGALAALGPCRSSWLSLRTGGGRGVSPGPWKHGGGQTWTGPTTATPTIAFVLR